MKTLVIIPARYASSRFPGKPLAEIKGKPMIQHVFDRVKSTFQNVYIATDDDRIENAAKKFNAPVVMTKRAHQSGTDRCREALEIIESQTEIDFDIVINLQGDEPLIDPKAVKLSEEVLYQSDRQISTLIKRIEQSKELFDKNIPKVVIDQHHKALYFSRQAIPFLREKPTDVWLKHHIYYKHIGLYAFRKDILKKITELPVSSLENAEKLEQNRWLEAGCSIYCAKTEYESLSVDTEDDLKKINSLI